MKPKLAILSLFAFSSAPFFSASAHELPGSIPKIDDISALYQRAAEDLDCPQADRVIGQVRFLHAGGSLTVEFFCLQVGQDQSVKRSGRSILYEGQTKDGIFKVADLKRDYNQIFYSESLPSVGIAHENSMYDKTIRVRASSVSVGFGFDGPILKESYYLPEYVEYMRSDTGDFFKLDPASLTYFFHVEGTRFDGYIAARVDLSSGTIQAETTGYAVLEKIEMALPREGEDFSIGTLQSRVKVFSADGELLFPPQAVDLPTLDLKPGPDGKYPGEGSFPSLVGSFPLQAFNNLVLANTDCDEEAMQNPAVFYEVSKGSPAEVFTAHMSFACESQKDASGQTRKRKLGLLISGPRRKVDAPHPSLFSPLNSNGWQFELISDSVEVDAPETFKMEISKSDRFRLQRLLEWNGMKLRVYTDIKDPAKMQFSLHFQTAAGTCGFDRREGQWYLKQSSGTLDCTNGLLSGNETHWYLTVPGLDSKPNGISFRHADLDLTESFQQSLERFGMVRDGIAIPAK